MPYDYDFCVWPDETSRPGWSKAIYDWFRMGAQRVEMTFTEGEFERFREEMLRDGFALREISRRPHIATEVVL